MHFRDILKFIGITAAIIGIATATSLGIAYFFLDARSTEQFSDALMWGGLAAGGLIFFLTPKHGVGYTPGDARQRLMNSQLEYYLLAVLVVASMVGLSLLVLRS